MRGVWFMCCAIRITSGPAPSRECVRAMAAGADAMDTAVKYSYMKNTRYVYILSLTMTKLSINKTFRLQGVFITGFVFSIQLVKAPLTEVTWFQMQI